VFLRCTQAFYVRYLEEEAVNKDQATEILAETENLIAWLSHEEAGHVYHLELGSLSLHLMPEEWDELVVLIESAASK
jgi:hypothetical protein